MDDALTAATQRAEAAEAQFRDANRELQDLAQHCERYEARITELAAALREIESDFPTGDDADYCQMQGCIGGKGRHHKAWCPGETARNALTRTPAQSLARWRAMERVCEAARQFDKLMAVTAPASAYNMASLVDLRDALAALDRSEGEK